MNLKDEFSFERSKKLFEEAKKVIPEGVNSGIRGPAWGIVPGTYPLFIEKAKGSKIYDVDGNEFIDYVLGYGPAILGHSHPKVNEAVRKQLEKGSIYGLSNENEIKVAKKVIDAVKCADMVRFTSTGTEANIGAVRIARAYTGKDKIAKFDLSYHGWEDTFLVGVAGGLPLNYFKMGSPGVPKSALEDVIILPWNNLNAVEKILKRNQNDIAVVITELFGDGWVGPQDGFIEALREITERYNIILHFDEVKTGFRLGLGGAQEYLGVTPDIATFGKAIGGGFPVAAIGGKRDIMETAENARLAGTFNACPVNMAASLATLSVLEAGGGQSYKPFLELGRKLQDGIRDVIEDLHIDAIVQGSEPMFRIAFTELEKITNLKDSKTLNHPINKKQNDIFSKEYVKRGIWGHPNHAWFLSMAHRREDIDTTIEVISDSLRKVKNNT
jgi:glutamate-1-semialdehyde 2,1-aminomutase